MSASQNEIEKAVDKFSSLEVIPSCEIEEGIAVNTTTEEDSDSVYIISSESTEPECIVISSDSKEEHRFQPEEAKSFEILGMDEITPLLLSTPKPSASK